ncbi:MAG: ABC transporter permease [Bacilli bacterium]
MKRNKLPLLGLIPFLLLLLGFLILPFGYMVVLSLKSQVTDEWSFDVYKEIFTNAFFMKSLWNSITISLFCSAIGIVASLVFAYAMTKLSVRTQRIVLSLANMTSNFSGIPLAFAFIIMLGNSGIFVLLGKLMDWGPLANFDLFSWTGLAMLYIYFQIPLGAMLLYPTFYGIRTEWKQSAALLGATRIQFWSSIGLPSIAPGIAGVFTILFANAMGAYASAFALVGSSFNLLPIQISALLVGDVFSRTDLASALAVVLTVILLLALYLNEWFMRRLRRGIE